MHVPGFTSSLGSSGRIPGHSDKIGAKFGIAPLIFFGFAFLSGILCLHFDPIVLYPFSSQMPVGIHFVIFTALRVIGCVSSLATMVLIAIGIRPRYTLAAAVLTLLCSGIVYFRITLMTLFAILGLMFLAASADQFVMDYEGAHKRDSTKGGKEDEDWLV